MKILVASFRFPECDTNSGDLRMFEILRILLENGHRVTFLAQRENDPQYREAVEALGIECVSDTGKVVTSFSVKVRTFLQEHVFDVAILAFCSIYNTYAPYIRTFLPECQLIFDTVDLHFLRLQREVTLTGDFALRMEASRLGEEESAAILDANTVWVVTEAERTIAKQTFGKDLSIRVVPNVHKPADSIPGYERRKGIVFLGGYDHRPNVDAVHYFMRDIFPLVQNKLPDVSLAIAGSHPPPEFGNYARNDPHVTVTGYVPDHRTLLAQHRVGIAPLRYGAGMKGKIGEYLACGLPTVTTPVGAEGMNLRHDHEVLIAGNPTEFATAIVRLYCGPILWSRLCAAGSQYIERRLCPSVVAALVLDGLTPARNERGMQPRPSASRAFGEGTNPRKVHRLLMRSTDLVLRCVRNPRRVGRLLMSSIEILRKGETDELWARLMARAHWQRSQKSAG